MSEPLFSLDEWGLPVPTEAWWLLSEEEQLAHIRASSWGERQAEREAADG